MEAINWENPYWELREFFRKIEKSPLTLTFGQIEDMIGDTLDWEAYFCEAFWFDEAPGMAGDGWDEEYPFTTVRPAARDFCIADAWVSQGYRIQRLHLTERRVVFRKEWHNFSALRIPPVLLDTKVPDDARYEIEEYLKYVVKKYGL